MENHYFLGQGYYPQRARGRFLITVTLVLVLLIIGYFGSLWVKRTISNTIGSELAEAGIYNVSFEGVGLRWLGVDIRSVRFDVEKNNLRQSFSLSDISIQSSLTSIQQRRIQSLSVDGLTVGVANVSLNNPLNVASNQGAGLKVSAFPIPSDLFLLLPADRVDIHQYTVQHTDQHWRVHSDQGVVITQDLLLTDFSFFYPEFPEIKATLQLNAENQITINLTPSLLKDDLLKDDLLEAAPSIQPVLVKLESQISGHYQQLTTSFSVDVDIEKSINHSAFVQEHIDRLVGKDAFDLKGELQMSADVTVNIEELLNTTIETVNDAMASVQGRGQLQLNDINVVGQGRSLSGLKGVLNFDMDGSTLSFTTDDIVIEQVAVGINVDSIDSILSGVFDIKKQAYQLNVASIDGHILGGELSLLPFSVTGPALNSEFEMQLNNVELRELLELQSNKDLSGEGQLSGFIQVSIKASVIEVHDGHFGSNDGHIRYQRNSVADAVSGFGEQQQLIFVLDAMEDFQYTSLETGVILKAPDNLHLDIALKGSNPNVEQGQMLHLNLNLEQNIGPLIQAANIDSALQNKISKQYQQ